MTPPETEKHQGLEPARIAQGLSAWLADRLPGVGPVRLGPLQKPGSGLSGGTLMLDAYRGDASPGDVHNLVVRIPAGDGEGLFPASDLVRELRVQSLLDRAGVPVAPVIGVEEDPSVLGRPFLVTRRVDGRLIDSSAPYLSTGWLHDGSEKLQTRLIESFLGVVADIHRIDLKPSVSAELCKSAPEGLGGALERWSKYLEWADVGGSAPDALHDAASWCANTKPTDEPESTLLWGDAQFANAVFAEDGTTRTVLDFELAAVGPAELDLGWFYCLHDMTVARCGEDLPGLTDRRRQLAFYEERIGRPVKDLEWYEVFAAVCTASILVRMATLLGRGGSDASWLARSNPALDYIAQRLR